MPKSAVFQAGKRAEAGIATLVPSIAAPLPPATQELANFAGVQATYEDAFGEVRGSPGASVRAILGALGFDASSEAAATAALAAARAREADAMLAPIYVIAASAEARLEVTVHANAVTRSLGWHIADEDGRAVQGTFVPADLVRAEATSLVGDGALHRYTFVPPVTFDAGYYRLTLRDGERERHATIASVPAACYLPQAGPGRGVWGLAAQLYALRSPRNWGIGDFTDLARLMATVEAAGGAAVGLNPLHQLRFGTGGAPSPYSPSSRLFLNWIYLDVEALPGHAATDVGADDVAALRAPEFVDYEAVAATKRRAARAAYGRFHEREIAGESNAAADFESFTRAGGEALRLATIFEALAERFAAELPPEATWRDWPAEFRHPASLAVEEFAASHEREIEFCAYLQWQADAQLGAAMRAAATLPIGLYRDLAVGAELSGADTWALQGVLAGDVSVGAPPDLLNRRGQNWGVAPFDPLALREAAYAPFIALLRANMRHAGALRIDHVMALTRLYWIPPNVTPADGAYVTYRLDDLLGIIALESVRARCIVIGEDLGTVPAGLRERLNANNILSYRLLQFESDDAGFFAPSAYPELALMCTGTHDLPFVGGYWTAHDVGVRVALGLVDGDETARRERAQRAQKRSQLLAAWRLERLTDREAGRFEAAAERPEDRETLAEIALWANRYLARARGLLLMIAIEDVFGEVEQVNIPSTTTEHPNWRRRLPIEVDALLRDRRFTALVRMLEREERASPAPSVGS